MSNNERVFLAAIVYTDIIDFTCATTLRTDLQLKETADRLRRVRRVKTEHEMFHRFVLLLQREGDNDNGE